MKIGFFNLLTIVFIVLRLTHVIDWSWWYCLAPTFVFVIGMTMLIVLAVIGKIAEHEERRRRRSW